MCGQAGREDREDREEGTAQGGGVDGHTDTREGSGRSRTKHAKCPITDPAKSPSVRLYEVLAGHVDTFKTTRRQTVRVRGCLVVLWATDAALARCRPSTRSSELLEIPHAHTDPTCTHASASAAAQVLIPIELNCPTGE